MEHFPQRGSVPQIEVFHTPRLCNSTGQVPDIRLPPHVACQGATSPPYLYKLGSHIITKSDVIGLPIARCD